MMIFEDAFFRDTAIEIAATPRIRAKTLSPSKAEKNYFNPQDQDVEMGFMSLSSSPQSFINTILYIYDRIKISLSL